MSMGAKALQASADAACPGAPLEQRRDMKSATGQSFKQRSSNHLTDAKRQPQTLAQQRSISKSQMEMNRNMLSYPQPSVPLRSLFYILTYCSKSQIFRNSSGWRYYQEKRSVSANQCNWGILSKRLRQWWQKLENQNPREGEAQATQIHRHGATAATFDSASDVLFCQKQVRSLTKTFSVFGANDASQRTTNHTGLGVKETRKPRRFLKSITVPNTQLAFSHELKIPSTTSKQLLPPHFVQR